MIHLLASVFSAVQPTYEDSRIVVLDQATKAYPVEALEAITPLLLSMPENFQFRWEIRAADFFGHIEAGVIEAWVVRHGLAGVGALVDSINVKTGDISPLVRFLLNHHYELVDGPLAGRVWEGNWVGSEVAYFEPKIESARSWAQDSADNVRR